MEGRCGAVWRRGRMGVFRVVGVPVGRVTVAASLWAGRLAG
ncbi:MAG: hypothetical protein R3F65_14445 [bacterium]